MHHNPISVSAVIALLLMALNFFSETINTKQNKANSDEMNMYVNRLNGTLVLAIPNKEGLLVCADDRMEDMNGKLIDNTNKLHKLGSKAILTATGSPIFIDKKTNVDLYNVFTEVAQFFSKKDSDKVGQYLESLRSRVERGFNTFLKMRKKEDWPESGSGPNHHLFRILLFYMDRKNVFQVYAVKVYFNKDEVPAVKVVGDNLEKRMFYGGAIFGDPKITDEITSGTNKEYDDLRIIIGHLNANRESLDQIPLREAEVFGRGFVRAYSEVAPKVFDEHKYGANAYCALLSYKSGFQWLQASN